MISLRSPRVIEERGGREGRARKRPEYATHLSAPQHVTASRHTEMQYPGADLSQQPGKWVYHFEILFKWPFICRGFWNGDSAYRSPSTGHSSSLKPGWGGGHLQYQGTRIPLLPSFSLWNCWADRRLNSCELVQLDVYFKHLTFKLSPNVQSPSIRWRVGREMVGDGEGERKARETENWGMLPA